LQVDVQRIVADVNHRKLRRLEECDVSEGRPDVSQVVAAGGEPLQRHRECGERDSKLFEMSNNSNLVEMSLEISETITIKVR
jgi:hypothetical protein